MYSDGLTPVPVTLMVCVVALEVTVVLLLYACAALGAKLSANVQLVLVFNVAAQVLLTTLYPAPGLIETPVAAELLELDTVNVPEVVVWPS
jgi:hypothetical protein